MTRTHRPAQRRPHRHRLPCRRQCRGDAALVAAQFPGRRRRSTGSPWPARPTSSSPSAARASIRAEGDAETLDRLEITDEGGQLHIGLRNSTGSWFSWGHHRSVTVHVTVPALAAASITGSGDMRIDRVQGPAFAGSVTGSGDLTIAALTADEASFTVTGSGDITAAGRAQPGERSVVGSGDLRLARLEDRQCDARGRRLGRHRHPRHPDRGGRAARLGRHDRRRPGPLHDQQVRLRRRPLRRPESQPSPSRGRLAKGCRALEACSECRNPSPRPLRRLLVRPGDGPAASIPAGEREFGAARKTPPAYP